MASFSIAEIASTTKEKFDRTVVSQLSAEFSRFEISEAQTEAWSASSQWIHDVASTLPVEFGNMRVVFEFSPPLSLERPDVIIVGESEVLVIEAKTGTRESVSSAKKQVVRYATTIFNYVDVGQSKSIIPVLVRPSASSQTTLALDGSEPTLERVVDIRPDKLADLVSTIRPPSTYEETDPSKWLFRPRPTIVDAARQMLSNTTSDDLLHSLTDDDELESLVRTCENLTSMARESKSRIVVAVSGVPGAGKTLVGLRLSASEKIHHLCEDSDSAPPLYLSGNGPLVDVLTEALARDERSRTGCTAEKARDYAQAKIRLIHGLTNKKFAVKTHLLIFDEAQRAWTEDRMRSKLQLATIGSEAEEVLSRMEELDWSVVICLVGTGQQINDGERGMQTWVEAVQSRAARGSEWSLFGDRQSAKLAEPLASVIRDIPELNLKVVRRADNASVLGEWVDDLLNGDFPSAMAKRHEFAEFPIRLTRSLDVARQWLINNSRPNVETFGLLASSRSARLGRYGVDVQAAAGSSHDWTQWFLDKPPNLNSALNLEVAATEFKCQGLELDRTAVCWSWDLVLDDNGWTTRRVDKRRGQWSRNESRRDYAINAYRVLLTRSRYGMVIWVPRGSTDQVAMRPAEMDRVAEVLVQSGASPI